MYAHVTARRQSKGFTLVELAVVVVIIGVLAAFGVPRFLEAVERSKAAEAFAYQAAVRNAQERYQAREGTYADNINKLDIQAPTPKYFDVGAMAITGENAWSLTLSRKAGSSGYTANYTVIFTQTGFDSSTSTIPADINPMGSAST